MIVLFFILSIAVLLLAVLLLWFVPHLLQQQEQRAARESRQLREVLSDMLGEQEAVALRQAQLGTSLSYLQDQIEQLSSSWPTTVDDLMSMPDQRASQQMLEELTGRIGSLQRHLDMWMQQRSSLQRQNQRDSESWANLMSLLSNMQERLGEIERNRQRVAMMQASAVMPLAPVTQSNQPLDENELEARLHAIADDLVALRWRLQRSTQARQRGERETNSKLNGHSQPPLAGAGRSSYTS